MFMVLGGVESYGYGVGFNLSTRLDLGGDIHFLKDTILLCNGETKILDAGSHFSTFSWNTGETTQKITVSKSGYYEVTASTSDGCQLTKGIHAIESHPVVNLGNDTIICGSRPIQLDAGLFSSYLWSTNDTARTISIKVPGDYGITVKNKYGCEARDSIKIGFVEQPKLDLSKLDSVICGTKSININISADKGVASLTSSNSGVVINNLSVTIPDFATYPFKFTATDQNSCSADTSFNIRFRKNTSVSIKIDSTCYKYSLDAKYLGDALINRSLFTWILAGDTLSNGLAKDAIHLQLGADRMLKDLSLKVVEEGCPGQVSTQKIDVVPDLSFIALDTLLCESVPFRFLATNSENVTDYSWDWGDGIVEHLAVSASHSYPKSGFYSIQLTAKTDKNCVNTVKKKNPVYVATIPTIDFSMSDNQCLDIGSHSLSYVGTADIKDHFNWNLTAFLPGELIQNPGDSKGPLIFDLKAQPQAKISLQVVSQYGCPSGEKELTLNRKPLFSLLTPESQGCTPFTVNLNVKNGDEVDNIDYFWNLGDGTTGKGSNMVHTYLKPNQPFDISILATSLITGCKDSLSKPNFVTVMPSPLASFSMDQHTFLTDHPTVKFQNHSIGANQYLWNFGDTNTSSEENPVHQYLVTGNRKILLQAMNSFGCTDTITDEVQIALNKIYTPNAFSPNAPNLIDREFKLNAPGVIENGYHFKILSRWNDVVFECRNEIKGWDGKLSNGLAAPAGNYIWILEFIDFLGKAHRQTGAVTLIY